jgi:hypothetical protein
MLSRVTGHRSYEHDRVYPEEEKGEFVAQTSNSIIAL